MKTTASCTVYIIAIFYVLAKSSGVFTITKYVLFTVDTDEFGISEGGRKYVDINFDNLAWKLAAFIVVQNMVYTIQNLRSYLIKI